MIPFDQVISVFEIRKQAKAILFGKFSEIKMT